MQRHRRGLLAMFAAGSLTVLLLWGMGQATTAAPIDVAADAGLTGSSAQVAGIALVMAADAVGLQQAKEETIPSVGVQEDEDGDEWKEGEEEEEEEDEEVYVEEDKIRAPLPVKAAPTKVTTGKKLRQLEGRGEAEAERAEKAAAAPSPSAIATAATTEATAPADSAALAALPYKETRELPWETEAWQRDLDELKALLDTDIEPAAVEAEASSLAADIGSDGHIETMGAFGNLMNLLSSSPDPAWPFCSPGGILYKVGLVCPVMALAAKILMRSPPDFEKLATEHHCPNPNGELPGHLVELSEKDDGSPVPMMIPKELVERERPTYAWYLTHIYNMYAYAFSYADDLLTIDGQDHYHTLRPLAPNGWENQNVYFVKDPQGWKWPIGQSLTKGERMVVFFRGTMFPGGWETDFKTSYAEKWATEKRGLPGRVHDGFFDFAEQFFEEFTREVDLHGIRSVTFAGHSLGGAISQVAAAFMVKHHYHLKINCVTFGSPQVGDRTFTDFLNAKINLRRVAYVGSGQLDVPAERGLNYGMGDVITQMPLACYNISMPFCSRVKFIDNEEGLKSFQFVMAAGNIPIYASDLRNTEEWLKKENFFFGARKFKDIPDGAMACHICSYACWTTAVTGDPDDRCYFPGEGGKEGGRAKKYLCDIDFRDSLTKRFPNLKGTPIDGDLVHGGAVAGGGGGGGGGEGGMLDGMWMEGRRGLLRKT